MMGGAEYVREHVPGATDNPRGGVVELADTPVLKTGGLLQGHAGPNPATPTQTMRRVDEIHTLFQGSRNGEPREQLNPSQWEAREPWSNVRLA